MLFNDINYLSIQPLKSSQYVDPQSLSLTRDKPLTLI